MKITKFVHSCLLVETSDRVALFNPGVFSWGAEIFDVNQLRRLDEILITHEHTDHLHPPFVRALRKKFPDVPIYTNPGAAEVLKNTGITNVRTTSTGDIEFFKTDHHSLEPMFPTPRHTGFHYLGTLTDPGDSHDFTEHKRVLALPITAPWGGMIQAGALIDRLRPQVVIPVHDWHWNDSARTDAYDTFEDHLASFGVKFIKPVDGRPFDV